MYWKIYTRVGGEKDVYAKCLDADGILAEEKLNCAEARQVLKMAEEVLDECCKVQKIEDSNEKSKCKA